MVDFVPVEHDPFNDPPAAPALGPAPSAGGLQVRRDSQGRQILQIHVNSELPPEQQPVVGDELGHVIDHLAGVPSSDPFWNSIPQSDAMRRELERVYSAGATGEHRTSNLVLPQHFGYPPEDVPAELMAEGGRAYLSNPNYFKTIAPNAAAAIRAAVNDHPILSKIIQFNSIPAIAGAGAAGYQLVPVDHDPFAQ